MLESSIPRGLTHPQFQSRGHFAALDGLRGIAIALVLLHHSYRFGTRILDVFLDNAKHGVSLFFVISGFLITTLFIREQAKTGTVSLLRFYARRALRLFPVYYLILGAYCLLIFQLNQFSPANRSLFREKLPSYIFYYSNWLPTATQGPLFQAWSLAVEEQFYFVFSFIFVWCTRRAIVLGAILLIGLKFAIYTVDPTVDAGAMAWRIIFSYQESILCGVLLAIALAHPTVYQRVQAFVGERWVLVTAFIGSIALLVLHPISSRSGWDAECLYLAMAVIVAGAVTRPHLPGLTFSGLRTLGQISYSIYLIHMLVIDAMDRLGAGISPIWRFAIAITIDVSAAWVMYRVVEAPIIAFYKRHFSASAVERTATIATDPTSVPSEPDQRPSAAGAKVGSLAGTDAAMSPLARV